MAASHPSRFVDADEPTLPRPPLTPWSRPATPEPPPMAGTPPTLGHRVQAHRSHPLAPEVRPVRRRRGMWVGFLAGGLIGSVVVVAASAALVVLAPTADPGAALGAAWDHVSGLLDDAPPAGIEPAGAAARR